MGALSAASVATGSATHSDVAEEKTLDAQTVPPKYPPTVRSDVGAAQSCVSALQPSWPLSCRLGPQPELYVAGAPPGAVAQSVALQHDASVRRHQWRGASASTAAE